jgi:hypothetical protein
LVVGVVVLERGGLLDGVLSLSSTLLTFLLVFFVDAVGIMKRHKVGKNEGEWAKALMHTTMKWCSWQHKQFQSAVTFFFWSSGK